LLKRYILAKEQLESARKRYIESVLPIKICSAKSTTVVKRLEWRPEGFFIHAVIVSGLFNVETRKYACIGSSNHCMYPYVLPDYLTCLSVTN